MVIPGFIGSNVWRLLVLLAAVAFIAAVVFIIGIAMKKPARQIVLYECAVLSVVYIGLFIWITVFRQDADTAGKANLIPFAALIESAKLGHIVDIRLQLEHIPMFIPLGVLMGYVLRRIKLLHPAAVAAGAGVSVVVELLQFITRRGVLDIDDIIFNTIGFAVGYFALILIMKLANKSDAAQQTV